MIGVLFQFASEVVEIRVDKTSVYFRTGGSPGFAPFDKIKLNKNGVVKEFPDLKEEENWERIARERFKEKMKNMKTEKERVEYIIKDLQKYGYKPLWRMVAGFRPEKLS